MPQLTEINCHRDEDDQCKPGVELQQEVEDRDDDVEDGRHYAEHDVVQQTVDAVRAAINHAQYLPGLTAEVPPQRQGVKMSKQTDLHRSAIMHNEFNIDLS